MCLFTRSMELPARQRRAILASDKVYQLFPECRQQERIPKVVPHSLCCPPSNERRALAHHQSSRGLYLSSHHQSESDVSKQACRLLSSPQHNCHSVRYEPSYSLSGPTTMPFFSCALSLAGGIPSPFLLRKNITFLFSPSAPSFGSTHWHQRALFQIARTKPSEPPSTSAR